MKRKRALIAGLSAMLVVAALVAVSAVASPTPIQAASDPAPSIRVRDTGEAFIVRWTVPESVDPQQQLVEAWTDDGYGRLDTRYASPLDDARQVEISLARDTEPGTAYGFRVSMLDGDREIQSRAKFLYPNGPMPKRAPSGLTAYWHNDLLRLDWLPGRNPNYVSQIAKCRIQERGSNWESIELRRPVNKVVFRDLDPNQSYVCRVEARKVNGHYQMTNSANANRKRIATPGNVTLQQTEREAETVRFGWSLDDTAGISKLLVQREGPLPNDYSRAYPGWWTIAELESDAASHVDTIAMESDVVFYNYRVVAVG